MSTALLFVNCISHIVKTCIRRNCKSYPVTTHKIVLTSSTMWLFDILKNEMSSIVPRKKWSSKVSNFISVFFSGRQFHKNPCWLAMHMKRTAFLTTVFADGMKDTSWKCQLWRWSLPACPILVKKKKQTAFCGGGGGKQHCWRQAHITLHERCKVSTDINKRIREDGLNLRTFTTRRIPQTKQQTERSWRLKKRTC